ncbi:FAS1-like dehydratase domain-containing protein [Aestuariimicrobium ganziense]|uniref:FAS1-like dehydratase domain-containing protein n=1 Tax=Aestuariimicrobium ganziense TaxID=2773677 RepID=UPI0019423656|nr:MaoC family dehydratase N-terminal domain-containing protein [Aestuariimicrobium ganziense]
MPISAEHVGRRYPATLPYRVSRAKIEEFAHAVGDTAAQADPTTAPPTFAMVIAAQAWQALFDDPDLGLALHRTVHGDQRFSHVRPLRDGDEVTAVLSIEKVRSRGLGDWVTIQVELTVEDEVVCTATSTLLHTREEESAA